MERSSSTTERLQTVWAAAPWAAPFVFNFLALPSCLPLLHLSLATASSQIVPWRWALAEVRSSAVPQGFGRTSRRDAWWWEVLPVVVGLGAFAIYATLRA